MPRRWSSSAAIAAVCLLAIGSLTACAKHSVQGQGALSPTAAAGAPGQSAPPASPGATATTPTTGTTSTPTTAPGTTHPASTARASAAVMATSATFEGLCAPPANATTFQAVITVHGVTSGHPVTVHWHWRTSNGGDSDPSTQSHTFTSNGTFTTSTHHESAYPAAPYPKTTNDWAAIVVSGAGPTVTSNHAAYSISCLPWVAVLFGNSTSYSGSCPPPSTALTFTVHISVSYPMTITWHWHTGNGGDSDPTAHSVIVVPEHPLVVDHFEASYTPGATTNDSVAVAVAGAGTAHDSNAVSYTETCTGP